MDATTSVSYLSQYVALLQETNQQLYMWSNPYGFMVAVLTFLVAFLAIAVTVGLTIITLRQSSEYKKAFAKTAEEFFASERQALRDKLDGEIKVAKEKLENATADERDELDKRVKKLEERKESIPQIGNASVYYGSSLLGGTGGIYPYGAKTTETNWSPFFSTTAADPSSYAILPSLVTSRKSREQEERISKLEKEIEDLKKKSK